MKETLPTSYAPGVASAMRRSPDNLRGPAGRLEALYVPGSPTASCAAIVSHPHPLFGGTMHNKVVYQAAKVFQELGMPVLRFNFRGAGASEGRHDRGEGEQQDLAAALDWLVRETNLPVIAAGFSFGAYVTLRTCCGAAPGDAATERVRGIVALGLPIHAGDRAYTYEFLSGCALPKVFISGGADEFAPSAALETICAETSDPSPLVLVAGADHFFQGVAGGLQQMQAAMRSWLEACFVPLDTAPDATFVQATTSGRAR